MATELLDLLRAYVGASPADDGFLLSCLQEAQQLVTDHVGSARVPDTVVDRATQEVAAELFHRRQAPGGIAQFAALDGSSPVRMARDPMQPAYPLLRGYLGSGLA